MNVKELCEALGAKNLSGAGNENTVEGVYTCDLLSRVMSGCSEGDAWITVQTHLNVLAVADLNEAACVIIPEGIVVDENTVDKATEKDVALLSSELTAYELCWKIHELMA